LTIIHNHLV